MSFSNNLADLGRTWRAAVRGRAIAWLRARVVWITSGPHDLDGMPARSWSFVAIWGREHYTETVVDHAIAKWSDAAAVARLHQRGRRPMMFHIGSFKNGKRRISYHELTDTAVDLQVRALFWIPESLLLSLTCPEDCVFTVDRKGVRYFLSAESTQVAGGLINSSANFALANGVRAGWCDRLLEEDAVRTQILMGLPRVSLSTWLSSVGPMVKQELQRVAAPLLAGIAALWLSSMLLAQLYLTATFEIRQRALDQLGNDVSTLLESQRRLDMLVAEQDDYVEAAGRRRSVLPVWAGFYAVWESGGLVRSAKWVDGKVSMNGAGNDATAVLEAITQDELISKAEFGSAVRQNNNLQEFMVNFEANALPAPAAGDR